MTNYSSQQQTEFAALRRALSEGDHEMVVATFELLLSMETPALMLLDAIGEGLWDEDDDSDNLETLLETLVQNLEASAIPDMAAYVMEENGPDLLVDLVAERLQEFSETAIVKAIRKALNHSDERISEGVRDYLDEMASDSDAAEQLLDELEEYD